VVAVVLLPAMYCHPHSNYHPTSSYYSSAFQDAVAADGGGGAVACSVLPGPSNNFSYAFRMLLLLLVAMVLLPAVYCHPHPNYHPTSNYYSCAFQNAVVAVGGSGAVACRVLPAPL
jgi:hypothetical protein